MEYLKPLDNGISFQIKTTTPSVVFSLLSKLSKSKATGLERISARVLRECPDLIANLLCIKYLIVRRFSRGMETFKSYTVI